MSVSNVLKGLFLLYFLTGMFSCRQSDSGRISEEDRLFISNFKLLDSAEAAKQIVIDKQEGFFDKIKAIDLKIQLQLPEETNVASSQLHQNYKQLLQTKTATFNESEQNYLLNTMLKAKKMADELQPAICDRPIQLIKYSGLNYGDGTYYTRDNCIVIPADKIKEGNRNKAAFLETMLHELFHIYSRYNEEKRDELYAIIGFHPIEKQLEFPAALAERQLLNPDGMQLNYAMDLRRDNGQTKIVIPVIFSMNAGFVKERINYFGHINFNIYEIIPTENAWKVQVDKSGYLSTLEVEEELDFYTQIGPNTDYIIHPDEVLADNFALLALLEANPDLKKNSTAEGMELFNKIKTVLQH